VACPGKLPAARHPLRLCVAATFSGAGSSPCGALQPSANPSAHCITKSIIEIVPEWHWNSFGVVNYYV
jgi:hypothetical protein